MEYGFSISSGGPLATPDAVATLVERGEELGFDFISVSDHVVIPRSIASRYPYSASGEYGGSGECLDQLTLLTFIAARSSRARLLTSVMVLPHRSPVPTAKMLASIDVLSGGRLIVGCGVGWMREEFEAIGAPPFDERGDVGDEYIRAFKELWTSDDPAFEGRYASFSDIKFEPKPVQKPHPPVWVGGESPRALRRAARLGDAWYPIGTNPSYPVDTPARFLASLARLSRHAEEAGRDPDELDLAYSVGWYDDPRASMKPEGDRPSFRGTPEQVASDVRAFADLGVRHLMVGFQRPTVEETVERMHRFAEEVIPLAAG